MASSRTILKENVKNGFPFMFAILVNAVYVFLLNGMVMKWQGADGLFALSIAILLILLVTIFCNGANSTFRTIGGLYYGQKDYEGLRLLFRRLMRIVMAAAVCVTLICLLFAPQIVALYGCDDPVLAALTARRLRIFALMFLCFAPLMFLPAAYQMMEHYRLVVFVLLLVDLLNLLGIVLLCRTGHAGLLWWSFPISSLLTAAIVLLMASRKRRTLPGTLPVTLLPVPVHDDEHLDISLPCSLEALKQSLGEIHSFVQKRGLSPAMTNRIELCTEELIKNIVEHAGISARHFIDVALSVTAHDAVLTVKDDGKPFNPIVYSNSSTRRKDDADAHRTGGTSDASPGFTDETLHLGITLLTSLCQDIDYKYMFGQNMTFLTWKTDETDQGNQADQDKQII